MAAFTPSHLSLIFSSSFLHCHCHVLKIKYVTQLNLFCFSFLVALIHDDENNFSCTFLLSTGIALKWLEEKAVMSDEPEVLAAVEIPPSYYNG